MSEQHISCEEVIERLFDYLDRELDAETSAEIDRHLKRCHDCFSHADFERQLRERVASSGTQKAPERLRRRIRNLLKDN